MCQHQLHSISTYLQLGLLGLHRIAVGLLGSANTGLVGFLLLATCLKGRVSEFLRGMVCSRCTDAVFL